MHARAPTELLEREDELRVLTHVAMQASGRVGSVVLVAGETGIGKTSLVATWLRGLADEVRVLHAACDDLSTPPLLGPFRELLASMPALAEPLEGNDAMAVAQAVLSELGNPLRPTVLAIEDIQWADDATLDVLRYVGRRVGDRRAVMALTYRDDELGADHPLRAVLGALAHDRVFRLRPRGLSSEAVRALAGSTSGLDADHVVRITSGNPFFVTELLVADTDTVPDTVAASVLGRLSQMPPETRQAVAVLACAPGGVEPTLLARLLPDASVVLAPAEDRGLFDSDASGRLRFRHELVRRAVVDAIPPTQAVQHHRAVLAALRAERPDDTARILHHAAAADDAEVLSSLAPEAARDAFTSGAHRQAAAFEQLALRHEDRLSLDVRASLWEQHAWSMHFLHRSKEATAAAATALARRLEIQDDDGVLRALTTRATMRFMGGDAAGGAEDFQRATTLAVDARDPDVLAEFDVLRLTVHHLRGEHRTVLTDGPRTLENVRRVGRHDLLLLAHIYHAGSRVAVGDDAGIDELTAAIDTSTAPVEAMARAHLRLTTYLVLARRWADARLRLRAALDFFEDHGFQFHRHVTLGHLARLHVEQGEWSRAHDLLEPLLDDAVDAGVAAAGPAHVAALLALRTDDPRAGILARAAWRLGADSQTEEHVVDGALAMLEWAWLHDEPAAADEVATVALATAHGVRRTTVLWWLARLGRTVDADTHPGAPETLALAGEHEAAAAAWAAMGMPYHQALTLIDAPRIAVAREGLEILLEIGAMGAVPAARRRLRQLGARRLPVGPQARTRANPGGLTSRQVDVLSLVAARMTNVQIAERLVLSVRTIDHHVSAILQKLDVPDRESASRMAMELGIVPSAPRGGDPATT